MNGLARLVLDHTDQMILLVDAASLRIVMVNQVASKRLGYSEEALLEKTILDVESALQDVFYWEDVRNGQCATIEAQEGLYLCADGSLLAATKSIKMIVQGQRCWLLIQARANHEEHCIGDDLARTTSQLRATLESTGNGILVIDWQGRIASMNRLFSTMWQLPEALLQRQDDEAVLDYVARCVSEPEIVLQRLREVVESKETEDVLHLTDGRVFQCTSLPQYLDERIIGRVFGFNDISERIRIENDLIAARQRAESANQAKADFLAMMSHEIRTPMNGVMGMTTLLLDTPLDSKQKHYLDIVRTSSESLLTIINDILDFSKIEARKLSLESIDFNLLNLLEDLADLYALRAAEKNLEFAWYLEPAVPLALRGDPGRIRQILINLIGNSLKFTPAGSISLRVTRRPDQQQRIVLHIEVSDTGIGISSDKFETIFSSFEQVDSTTTRKYGGTGLGLAISKQLVELMGGRISVLSQEGQGTCFSLEIRLEQQPNGCGAPDLPEAGVLTQFKGQRLLVFDENALALQSVTTLLGSWGFAVEGTADADRALHLIAEAQARSLPFRCLIVDVGLTPGVGERLGRSVLAAPGNAALSVLMCVSAAYRGDLKGFEQEGFAACLVRPLRRATLLDCLRQVLSGQVVETQPLLSGQNHNEAGKQDARLLLVEDNPINTLVMKGLFAKLGYTRIDSAVDGMEAVERVEGIGQAPYALILMDCQMPRMDGYSATRRLRELGIRTPIVAMTAHTLSGDREKCIEAGMDDYLAKPIAIDLLAACLERWLPSAAMQPMPASLPAAAELAGGSEDDIFSYALFLKNMMDDSELAATLLRMFLANMPGDIGKLHAAVADGNDVQVRSAAHFIKGAAANMCALGINAIAYEIEQAARQGQVERAVELLPKLDAQWVAFLKHPRVMPFLTSQNAAAGDPLAMTDGCAPEI
jgi:two-component system sensor histidine kinase/response regulator